MPSLDQAFYSVPELARVAGVHREKMRRLLIAASIPIERQGRATVVFSAALRESAPVLWESLACRMALQDKLNRPLEERVRALELRIAQLETGRQA